MKQRPTGRPSSEKIIRDIKRNRRKQYSAEEKIRIVLDGVRGEDSIAQRCRREGIAQSLYYKWSKDFMEAGKKRLAGDIVRQANTSDVTALRGEARDLKEVVRRANAGTAAAQKKHARGWGGTRMRYPASEKLEIIRLVERSHLPAKQTLAMLGIARTTFYRWYARYRHDGAVALQDQAPLPGRVWNRIPRYGARPPDHVGAEQAGTESARVGGDLHRYRGLFCLRKLGLPASQSPPSDHPSGLHRHQGRQRVHRQDHGHQSAVADGFYLPEDHWLGLDVSIHDTG